MQDQPWTSTPDETLVHYGVCGSCHYRFFPPQSYGCERCGEHVSLDVAQAPAAGQVTSVITVNTGASPVDVAEILIPSAGVSVLGQLATPGLAVGDEVVGRVMDRNGRQVLAFERATEAAQ